MRSARTSRRSKALRPFLLAALTGDGARRPPHDRLRNAAPLLYGLIVGAIPSVGNRSEPAFLTLGLEAEPPVGELRCDKRAGKPFLPSIDTASPLGRIGSILVIHAPLGEPPLGCGGMDLPYIPGLSVLIGESSVGQTNSCGGGISTLAAKILPARPACFGCHGLGTASSKVITSPRTLRILTRSATIVAALCVWGCQRDYSTVQGKEMRAALGDLAAAEDIYYATNLHYSADQSLIVSLTLPRDVALSIDSADDHGWHASATHKYGIETCYEWGRNDGSATLATVDGPDCKPLHASDTLRDVRSGKMVVRPPSRDRSVETLAEAAPTATPVFARVANAASPVEIGSVLLPAIEPAEDFGYPTQTVDRLAIRKLLLSKSYDALDRILATLADSALRDYRVEYRLFDGYAAFAIAVPSMEPYLTEWVKQHPNSAAAHLARASFFRESAWNARGFKYSSETKREQFVRMGNFLRLTLVDLDAALRLDPNSIAAYRQLIDVASFNGDTRASRSFLDKALKLQPNSFVLRMAHMHNLAPRWGGSYEEMAQFAAESAPYAKRNPRITALNGYVDLDLGRAAEAAGRSGDAIEAYQRALRYGNLWEFRWQRGRYNSRANQEEAALADFNSVLLQYPQFADALNDRSASAYEIGRQTPGSDQAEYYSQAFRDILLAAALDPVDADIQESVAFFRKNIPRFEPPTE